MAAEDTTDSPEIRIGTSRDDYVLIRVMGRANPNADDYWDGNWLVSPIQVVVGGFRGEVGAGLRMEELVRFRESLAILQTSLQGEALLDSMEGWIRLRVLVDSLGGVQVIGKIVDKPGSAIALNFTIRDLDQTHLPAVISALSAAEARFPVRGKPGK